MSAWPSIGVGVLGALLLAPPLDAAEVPVAARPPVLDGDLREWGSALWLPLETAAPEVGLRGAFEGEGDYEVQVYLSWDADFLYMAAMVEDDSLDSERIAPGRQVWKGPQGQRKDRMFFYDHFKLFVRGPDMPLGFNLWMGPGGDERGPYSWGGRQRNPGSEQLPVQLASAREEGVYTYEVGVPWSWLELQPQPDMALEALFLFVDADSPGRSMEERVKKGEKSIWWRGKLYLRGRPPGLREPLEVVAEVVEGAARRQLGRRVDHAIAQVKAREESAALARKKEEAAKAAPAEEKFSGAEGEQTVEAAPDTGAVGALQERASAGEAALPVPDWSIKGLRQRQERRQRRERGLPEWVQEANEDQEVSPAQVEVFMRELSADLLRVMRQRVDSRTDAMVIDMAGAARTERRQARVFLSHLLGRALVEFQRPEGILQARLAQAARQVGVEIPRAAVLVESICDAARRRYEKDEVTTTGQLLKKGRREARVSAGQARALIQMLLEGWVEGG